MPNLTINGQSYFADAPPDTPLLWVIREDLRLTGTKYGCGVGLCGSCTVHIDGKAVRSCSIPVVAVEGSMITTIEGLKSRQRSPSAASMDRATSAAMRLLPIRSDYAGRRLAREVVETLLEQQIVDGMTGNLCRCANIFTHRRCREASRRDHELSRRDRRSQSCLGQNNL